MKKTILTLFLVMLSTLVVAQRIKGTTYRSYANDGSYEELSLTMTNGAGFGMAYRTSKNANWIVLNVITDSEGTQTVSFPSQPSVYYRIRSNADDSMICYNPDGTKQYFQLYETWGERVPFKEPVPYEYVIYITNEASQSINFDISSDNANWSQQTLKPKKRNYYYFNGGVQKFGYIRLLTQGKGYVQYKLDHTKGYVIKWNSKKACWDVFNQ